LEKVRMLEQGKLTLERTPAQLDVLATTVVQVLRTAALDGKVDVQVHARGDVSASIDVQLMQRALENLLMNALRHTKERVDLDVVGDERELVISVSRVAPTECRAPRSHVRRLLRSAAIDREGAPERTRRRAEEAPFRTEVSCHRVLLMCRPRTSWTAHELRC